MTRVHWTPQASDDLDAIHEHIGRDSSGAARLVAARLIVAVDQLETFPQSGRVVPEFGDPALRELLRGAYRIVYRVRAGGAEIITVHHSARPLPVNLDERGG